MTNTLIQKIPCYRHQFVIDTINNDGIPIKEKSQKIHDYAYDYARRVTNHTPDYVLSAGAIEQVLLAIESVS